MPVGVTGGAGSQSVAAGTSRNRASIPVGTVGGVATAMAAWPTPGTIRALDVGDEMFRP